MNTTYPRTVRLLAVISLILGIFGFLGSMAVFGMFRMFIGGFVLAPSVLIVSAPAAVICGHAARWKIRRTPGCIEGGDTAWIGALIGLILGWISTGFLVGLIILGFTGYGRW